eukprot:CAMPEP_0172304134 /NCGR_PEP_ID=MMETSP1058-20130122/5580_1 /TAXON_ID=83371 /ORGANISM="Detonula confervacea, Strain CCMP 353" /LENGTH=590 /DNA_ID=CAMNT_0013015237 /DNA_START=177 /DNA_END=1949 /DNA_ORIENTATION=+
MADDNSSSAGVEATQNIIVAAAPSNDKVTTDQDTKSDNQNNNNDDKDGSIQNNGAKQNSKQRKASRWKSMNQKKKDQKREKMEQYDKNPNKKSKTNNWKKDYGERGAVTPHDGSFADENMRKLFDVNIDVPSSSKEEGGDASNGKEEEKTSDDTSNNETADIAKVPKRKLAILVSFLGSNYSGFQINSEKRTLQAEIELGLYRAGIISQMNFGHPQKYSWSNSARTDKGVHAAAQVCSFKGEMIFHNEMSEESQVKEQMDAMREKVNEHLPESVRVLDIERVTRMFCARTSRDKVRYQYMVPSYMLCSQEEVQKAFSTVEGNVTKTSESSNMTPMEASKIVEDTVNPEVLAQARNALINHRVTSEQIDRLKNGLKLFEGTHFFHNYTRRIGSDNASAQRYILSFAPLDPILVPGGMNDDGSKKPDTQWVPLQVVGQSFLLNQIRKMVSGAVDLARGAVSQEKIEESFSKQCRMKVNVAPAQGLFLDRSFFELYNKHKVENAVKHGDTRDRDMLDWVEAEGEEVPSAVRRIEEFKNEKIIPHIVQEEEKEGNFFQYLYAQDVLYASQTYGPIEDANKASNEQNNGTETAEK